MKPEIGDEEVRFCLSDIEAGRPTKTYEPHPQIQQSPSAARSVPAISTVGRCEAETMKRQDFVGFAVSDK